MKKHYTTLALLLISIYCQAQSPEQNLKKLGIQLQEPDAQVANDVNYVRTGNLIYFAGSGPDNAYKGVITGKLGKDITIEEAREAARHTGINLIATLKNAVGAELVLGTTPEAKVLQVILPKLAPTSNITEPTELGLTYLTGYGQPITGTMAANVNLNVSGVSMYDGTPLSSTSADVTFYLDSTATLVNLNGQIVRRATVETVNNAS